MKNTKGNRVILWIIIYIVVVVAVLGILFHCAYEEKYSVSRNDWLNMCFAWISSMSAVFLGFIAYWQNERFKIHAEKSAEETERINREYQERLLEINNRLIKLEEQKEYAYIAFTQDSVLVGGKNIKCETNRKTYVAAITNNQKKFEKITGFVFRLTNQTDVPIRSFQILDMVIEYSDYGNSSNNIRKGHYGTGGFVPSPMIARGEIINYALFVNELDGLAENLPDGMEISLKLKTETVSIYNRTTIQEFLLRLQRKNVFFNAENNKNIFWNYCFEGKSELK